MQILRQLEQGSPEWHAFRAVHRQASETPALMGCSPWFPKTPVQLARVKRGLDVIEDNPAMKHGRDNEQKAREWCERNLGEAMSPCVVVDGEYAASLDGLTFDRETILEVKAPPNGRSSHLYQETQAGRIPPNYMWQMQHQLMVSGAHRCLFAVWDGVECLKVYVDADLGAFVKIREAWDAFWPLMTQEEEPVEYVEREDEPWAAAATKFLEAHAASAKAEEALNAAKAVLEEMANKENSRGAGVKVTRRSRKGNVNYKAIPELKDVDLEKFRLPTTGFWQVDKVKSKTEESLGFFGKDA